MLAATDTIQGANDMFGWLSRFFRWLSRFFRWLPRHVKQVTILGVGIELRETPANPQAAPAQPPTGQPKAVSRDVQRQDYVCVSGTSASSQRTPREIDLMADGEEIQLHIHKPGVSQSKLWVGRKALEEAFARWKQTGGSGGEITVPGRTARKEAQVAFVFDDSNEVEVQAGWWIWVGKQDLKAALAELGVRAPW
jgi:hypothetical protein